MQPVVSIVICTYNREGLLVDCLRSLENQSASKNLYEVVIVNNNSTDGTQQVAEGFVARNGNFRVCVEMRQGLSNARNRGIEESRGGWIAYIDDDAREFPDYVERAIGFIGSHPEASCFGGPCVPLYHFSKPDWYLDAYQTGMPSAPHVPLLPDSEFVNGFNIVFKRQVLLAMSGFNPLIGMTGRKMAYGEETQVQVRIRKAGGHVYFFPELLVHHYIDSYKLRFLWFFKSSFANGRDSWETFEHVPTMKERINNLNFALRLPFRKFRVARRRWNAGDFRVQNFLIDCFVPSFWYIGRALSTVGEPARARRDG